MNKIDVENLSVDVDVAAPPAYATSDVQLLLGWAASSTQASFTCLEATKTCLDNISLEFLLIFGEKVTSLVIFLTY